VPSVHASFLFTLEDLLIVHITGTQQIDGCAVKLEPKL
jgi:hypothetical protein